MVIDMLNMTEHTKLQKASFEGKSSEQISEYEGLDQQIAALTAEQAAKSVEALQALNWKMIWAIPAVLAALAMILFGLLFHENRESERPV
jgi:hypothetical protein